MKLLLDSISYDRYNVYNLDTFEIKAVTLPKIVRNSYEYLNIRLDKKGIHKVNDADILYQVKDLVTENMHILDEYIDILLKDGYVYMFKDNRMYFSNFTLGILPCIENGFLSLRYLLTAKTEIIFRVKGKLNKSAFKRKVLLTTKVSMIDVDECVDVIRIR